MTEAVARPHNPLSTYKIPVFRFDVQAVVAGVLVGTAVTALLQITERLDTAIFGAVIYPFGILSMSSALISMTYLYGMWTGFIVAEINPFISTMTATSPLSWFFFLQNGLFVPPLTFLFHKLHPMDKWWKWAVTGFVGGLPPLLATIPVQVFIIGVPWGPALFSFAFSELWLGFAVSTVAMYIARAVLRSGIVK